MLIALLKIDTLTQTARNLLSDLCIEILSVSFLFFQHVPFSSYLLNSISLGSALSVSYAPHISKLSQNFPEQHFCLEIKSNLYNASLLYF